MRPSTIFLEQAGWFLVDSFLLGLIALPTVWFLQRAVANCRTSVRSACAIIGLLAATVVPLTVAWSMVTPAHISVASSPIETSSSHESHNPLPDESADVRSEPLLEEPELDASESQPISTPPIKTNEPGVSTGSLLVRVLPWLWLSGASLTGIILMLGLVGSRRLQHRAMELPECLEKSIASTLSLVPGVSVGVRISELVQSPILVGIIRPLVLLPTTAIGWTPETLQFVVLHELRSCQNDGTTWRTSFSERLRLCVSISPLCGWRQPGFGRSAKFAATNL